MIENAKNTKSSVWHWIMAPSLILFSVVMFSEAFRRHTWHFRPRIENAVVDPWQSFFLGALFMTFGLMELKTAVSKRQKGHNQAEPGAPGYRR